MLILLVLFARLVICYNGRQVCNRSNAGTHITLLKDVFLNCNGTIGNGDVVSASQHCKDNDKCSVFVVYNGQVTFCNYNPDAKVEGLKNINGSWVGISDRLEALANMKLTNKGDMICEHAANADDKENHESSKTTQPLATSPSFLTLESLTKNCNSWASSTGSTPMLTGRLRNKDSPHTTKMRGCVCGLSGSIRPDDYHHTYYAGDVVPWDSSFEKHMIYKMVKLKKGSKRQELARKYNIERMVAAHKKKIKKLKNKGELKIKNRKPPQIPNCIFKKEVLDNIKRTKEITDAHTMEQKQKKTS